MLQAANRFKSAVEARQRHFRQLDRFDRRRSAAELEHEPYPICFKIF
jgi:hypothetical protein